MKWLMDRVFDGVFHKCSVADTIGGIHILIICPAENPTYYYNRKGFYPFTMQALVDFQGLFMDM